VYVCWEQGPVTFLNLEFAFPCDVAVVQNVERDDETMTNTARPNKSAFPPASALESLPRIRFPPTFPPNHSKDIRPRVSFMAFLIDRVLSSLSLPAPSSPTYERSTRNASYRSSRQFDAYRYVQNLRQTTDVYERERGLILSTAPIFRQGLREHPVPYERTIEKRGKRG
jgi:hypothetical protein